MRINKLGTILIGFVIMVSLLFGGTAYAQDEELPDPGITPDSPFYFFDTLGKNIGMFFAFGPEAKVRKALEYAEERLAEANAMALKNREKALVRAAGDYDKYLAIIAKNSEKVDQAEGADDVSERVATATSKHLAVLARVREAVTDQARDTIDRAREASLNGQKKALRALAERKTERAMEINAGTIESMLNRARVQATDTITEEVEEALEDVQELLELEDEISEIARARGRDITFIEQQIVRSTANRLDVLEGVFEKAPAQARLAIVNAMSSSVEKYNRVIESLENKNALGEAAEDISGLERLREELKGRLRVISENVTVQERLREENKERLRISTEAQSSENKTGEKEEDKESNLSKLSCETWILTG
ncbi:MAG: DUF5667 domain-containing protein [Dehalococcoidales bacterium]|nr:DUF5667 domain-containing protein [Dehalococcoidales bacterium]